MTIQISDKQIVKIQDLYNRTQTSEAAWHLLVYEMIYLLKKEKVIKELDK